MTVLMVLVPMAKPVMAKSIKLSLIQNLLQGIVDAFSGPLGVVNATLALKGVFLNSCFNIIDLRQALWVLVGIAGVAAAVFAYGGIDGAPRSPLFLGFVRPPKLFGLPIMHAAVWVFRRVLSFVWIKSFVVLGVAAVLYPVLCKAAA